MRHVLDAAWEAVPIACLPEAAPRVLVLADPGGQLLAGLLRQGWEIDAGVRRSGFLGRDLCAIAREAAECYFPVADARPSTIRVDGCAAMFALGDPQLLAQAAGNLIDNAIKYSDAGSTIDIYLSSRSDGNIALEVRHRGPGISDADRPKVIERFYRGDKSRATAGNGLGLTLLAAVAQLHCGSLELSDNDPGLTARLLIPTLREPHGGAAPDQPGRREVDAGRVE